MTERWKPIIRGRYAVSDFGRVKTLGSYHKERILSPKIGSKGYPVIELYDGKGNHKTAYVHRLVLETFIGPCPDGMEARHLNDDPSDNKLDNLVWGTHKENMMEMVENGGGSKGDKLTEEDVIAIRKKLEEGIPGSLLAEEYGITHGLVSMIKNRQRWRRV